MKPPSQYEQPVDQSIDPRQSGASQALGELITAPSEVALDDNGQGLQGPVSATGRSGPGMDPDVPVAPTGPNASSGEQPGTTSASAPLRFPIDVLPGPARRIVEAAAQSLSCPPDLIGTPVLVALGTAIGAQRCLEVKPGWNEYPSVYAAVVAGPGSAKSPGQALAMKPLHRIQEEWLEAHQQDLAERLATAAEERNSDAVANKKVPADKERDAADASSGKAETTKGKPVPRRPNLPADRQLISTDATTEALGLLLKENEHGICYEQDELTTLTGGFNKYRRGVGTDRQFFQSAWSGQPINTHRVKLVQGARRLDTNRIDQPSLCVVGGIQPDMLGELPDERGREDGFIHRFVFTFPDDIPHVPSRTGVGKDVQRAYHELIERLCCHLPVSLATGAPAVHFTQGAQDAWHKFEESHGAESQCPKFPDYLRGPWRKLTSYCARFALILQMARYAAGEASCGEVDETSLAGAIRLVEYFKSHARKVYGHLRREPSNERMAILMEWVNRHGGEVSVREVVTAKVAGCKTNGEALELFSRLRQAGVGAIQAVKNPKGGRPKIVFSLRKAD